MDTDLVFSKNKRIPMLIIDKNNHKVLSLFIPNTKKWFRFRDFSKGFGVKVKNINEAKKILYEAYDKYNRTSVEFNDLISFLHKNNSLRTDKISNFNKNTAFYEKLRMLNSMNIINRQKIVLRNKEGKFRRNYKLCRLNKNINEWRLPSYQKHGDI